MYFTFAYKNFGKILFALTAISFLWIGTFGLLQYINGMESGGMMGDCPFTGQMGLCTMNFSTHIEIWQNLLTVLPQNIVLLNMLILAAIFVAVIVFWQKNNLFKFSERVVFRWKLYVKQHPQVYLFNSLREEFSQGILNPKIYASAIV